MRTASPFLVPLPVIAFVFASCAYDAELLGKPEPEPIKGLEHIALPKDTPYKEIESQPAETPIEFAPSERLAIFSPADSLDMFADLRFFGSWYWHDQFGWVWRPTMARTWKPMTQGYWEWTENDWMWVTSDRFGSDPYNYGYWVEDTALGWVWMPDCSWQPVRCQWMQWDTYVAWAPLLPPDVGEYRGPWEFEPKDTPWLTVRVANFMKYDVARYRVLPKFKRVESENTLSSAPLDVKRLERVLGHKIERIHIPWRQPPIIIVREEPIFVPVPVPDPCPPDWDWGPEPVPFPDPPIGGGGGGGGEGKMKSGGGSNAATKNDSASPRKFKDAPPPSNNEKKKAK